VLRGDLNLRYGGGMQLAKPKSPSKYPYWVQLGEYGMVFEVLRS